jgi:hypothetical protein
LQSIIVEDVTITLATPDRALDPSNPSSAISYL